MHSEPGFRQTAWLGMGIAALGLICLGSGVALLIWRLVRPDAAVLLPPGEIFAVENTPTPGLLGTAIPPPPLPDDLASVAILPVSEHLSPTPTETQTMPTRAASPTLPPSHTPSVTPTQTARPTFTATPISIRLSPPARTIPPALPSLTFTAQPTSTPTATPSLTASPTASPTPTLPPSIQVAIPDRILIDAIGLDAPVIPVGQRPVRIGGQTYSQWSVPDTFAAGWHINSAPLGQPGNTVLNGHHNVNGAVFHYLVALKPGDIITLEAQNRRFYYLVAQTMTLAEEGQPVEIRQQNARWILPTTDERVTLITCWPYSTSNYRLVIIALPAWKVARPAEVP